MGIVRTRPAANTRVRRQRQLWHTRCVRQTNGRRFFSRRLGFVAVRPVSVGEHAETRPRDPESGFPQISYRGDRQDATVNRPVMPAGRLLWALDDVATCSKSGRVRLNTQSCTCEADAVSVQHRRSEKIPERTAYRYSRRRQTPVEFRNG